ncbi:MAG: addiction module protein [Verrucomicrobia bacterium]|nr:addiction module protein [Verrucomicrobiota bacterium]|tara:strand:+ start:20128 stop:20337 length:210 start_codon:yes stop_codon:yes gene_type:complete
MSITEIRKLPLHEKFQIMEALWEDLRPEIEKTDIPEHHKKLLDERRARVKSGEERLLDWDAVKNSYGHK